MKYLKTLLMVIVAAGILSMNAMAAAPGDTGISYKNNTAYLLSVEESDGIFTETWVLRKGHQDDWDTIEAQTKNGFMFFNIYMRIDNMGDDVWVARFIRKLGPSMFDTGWKLIGEEIGNVRDGVLITDNMIIVVVYLFLNDDGKTLGNSTKLVEYKQSSKSFIEGLIYGMAWADYHEGQEGR